MQRPVRPAAVILVAFTILLSACSGAGPTPGASTAPTPGASTAPTPGASTAPKTAEDAVRLVKAANPRFASIVPLQPDLIGQSAWYEVSPGTVGWQVQITIGWGDCQAGCISRHVWTYAVSPDGTVSLVNETGDVPVPSVATVPGAGRPGVAGTALEGPVCPVEKNPPDPLCADRPVAGAVVIVRDASGNEIARATTAADGTYAIDLAPGDYTVEAQPVEGIMGAPAPVTVSVPAGATDAVVVDLGYDTGIR